MDYIAYHFQLPDAIEEYQKDILIDALAQIGFDTFEDTATGFVAYVSVQSEDEAGVIELRSDLSELVSFDYERKTIPHQNWNALWESNFEPLRINDRCYVRATFHEPHPEYEFEIVVDPKMAFGTGHHQTTAQIMNLMMEDDFAGKTVLDMGCGTGILAILAKKLGASATVAIDYDPLCYDSTIENCALNHVEGVTALCGSKEAIPAQQFEIILANINRNILLDQMESYKNALAPGGRIYFSGFYEEPDMDIIREAAASHGMAYVKHSVRDRWTAMVCQNA